MTKFLHSFLIYQDKVMLNLSNRLYMIIVTSHKFWLLNFVSKSLLL